MDEGSLEELRVYTLMQKLENRLYSEKELCEMFGFKCPLRNTRLYKYIKAEMDMRNLELKGFKLLEGELVSGEHVQDRTPILRGKYRVTTVIDHVHFTFVERKK